MTKLIMALKKRGIGSEGDVKNKSKGMGLGSPGESEAGGSTLPALLLCWGNPG